MNRGITQLPIANSSGKNINILDVEEYSARLSRMRNNTMDLTLSVSTFVSDLGNFVHELSVLDHVWNVLFPDSRGKWQHLHVSKYKATYYITHTNGTAGSLEFDPINGVRASDPMGGARSPAFSSTDPWVLTWRPLLTAARKWLKVVGRDWIKSNRRVQAAYPLRYRYGVVHKAVVRASLPDMYRLDVELGARHVRRFVDLIESGFFIREENTHVPSMTAATYFEYCRIAYRAGVRKDEALDKSLSGRDMYARYADGRHEGLLNIDPASPEEFAAWLDGSHPKRGVGGHPWEIKRGGNTTHIDLSVSRPAWGSKEGFRVELRGESIGRMVETVRMFLAIHAAKLPISIAEPESVRKRLLALDNIGIVPSCDSLHRANQRFKKDDDVFDVMYYDDFGRYKRRIAPFILWEQLPVLMPSGM